MSYAPFKVERFDGLDLRSDPQEGGPTRAVDILNAVPGEGRIRTRDGFETFYSQSAGDIVSIMSSAASDGVLIAVGSSEVRHISGLGAVTTTLTLTNSDMVQFAHFSTASASGTYIAAGSNYQIRKYDAGTDAFSSPASLATYDANGIAVQAQDNRLVWIDANDGRIVRFSNAGLAETVSTDDFVAFYGASSSAQAICSWQNLVFVFFATQFAVFYGNSVDATGGTVFNYRMVDTGIGVDNATGNPHCVAVHPTGVYFVNRTGIWRTQGDAPVRISDPVAPIWIDNHLPLPAAFGGAKIEESGLNFIKLAVSANKLYMIYNLANTSTNAVLVYDIPTDQWSYYDWNATFIAPYSWESTTDPNQIFMGVRSGANENLVKVTDATTDAGTAITWRWQSGFYGLSDDDQGEAFTRYTSLRGVGSPTLAILTDYGTSDSNAAAVTLGTSPTIAEGYHQKAYKGTLFSHKLSGTSYARVSGLTHWISHMRNGGRAG